MSKVLVRRLTLRQLKVFETVARLSGFNRAAKELHLAQPTVSLQVRQLADAIGMPLYEQIGKKIYITEAGALVRAAAGDVFSAFDRLEMQLAQLKGLKTGRLKVSVVTTAKYFIPRLLGPFTRHYPGIDIAMDVGNRSEIVARLSRNEDDLYIMGMPPAGIDFERHSFVENPIVAIAPYGHPLSGVRRVSLARLAQEPFLLREQGSGTRMAAERFLKSHGVKLKVRMELGSNEAIKQAVAGGLGLSLLSLHALKSELARKEVVMLDVEALPIRRSWYIVHRKGKELSIVARTFFDYLKEEGANLERELQLAQAATVARATQRGRTAAANKPKGRAQPR
ncbi:MAG: LysR family transcriptional regulator [Burkholderiales bacterium]|nr:LysR family transcriptional regulator [Burkholderiales bacterium]